MDDANSLKYLQDPRGFMEVVMNHDPDARHNALKHFVDIAICEIVRLGVFNDLRMIDPLRQFYRQVIVKAPENKRFEIFNHVKGLVENTDFVSANAFLPFIVEDTSRGVVSTAVIDYVSLAGLTDADPMSRVKDIVGMIEDGSTRNVGAAFGALLFLGDDRVCSLLVPVRDTLDEDAVREATNCVTGLMYGSSVDFYLDWLESVREHHAGLHSFRSMRRMEARRRKARALWLRHSQSLASRRQRPSQAKVRSTIQRLGSATNPVA